MNWLIKRSIDNFHHNKTWLAVIVRRVVLFEYGLYPYIGPSIIIILFYFTNKLTEKLKERDLSLERDLRSFILKIRMLVEKQNFDDKNDACQKPDYNHRSSANVERVECLKLTQKSILCRGHCFGESVVSTWCFRDLFLARSFLHITRQAAASE